MAVMDRHGKKTFHVKHMARFKKGRFKRKTRKFGNRRKVSRSYTVSRGGIRL